MIGLDPLDGVIGALLGSPLSISASRFVPSKLTGIVTFPLFFVQLFAFRARALLKAIQIPFPHPAMKLVPPSGALLSA